MMMKPTFYRCMCLSFACCGLGSLGCVERRFLITTDPPEAIVFDWKGQPRSGSPSDIPWVYNGTYQFTIMKDGYETLVVQEKVRAQWYEWVGVDFVSENLIPFTIRDIRKYHYQLKPLQVVPAEDVLPRATELQQRGRAIGPPRTNDQVLPPPGSPFVTPPLTAPVPTK